MNNPNGLMEKYILLRVYRKLKNNPNKVFIMADFGLSTKKRRVYLDVLVSLGLIEQVDAVYKTGKKYVARREVKGYRLIQRGINK